MEQDFTNRLESVSRWRREDLGGRCSPGVAGDHDPGGDGDRGGGNTLMVTEGEHEGDTNGDNVRDEQ